MGKEAERWRVSQVLRDPSIKQRVAAWEQAHAAMLTPDQQRVLTEIATAIQDWEAERLLDGDRPLEEMSRDSQVWAEFIKDEAPVKKRYNSLMVEAVQNGLFASPQYCRQYYRDRRDKVSVRFVVLHEAHPLVSEWVRLRRAVGDKVLHCFWRTTHAALDHGVPRPLFGHEGEADLAEEVVQRRRQGHSWKRIFSRLPAKGHLLRNKKGQVRHKSKEALRKWAIAHNLEEARPPGMSQEEQQKWREIQQQEAHKLQQRGESIEKFRALELTPQLGSGYVARVHTASGDHVEAQAQDRMGALMTLSQHLRNQWPGEPPYQGSDT